VRFLVELLAFAGWGEQNDLGLSIDQHIVLDAIAFFLSVLEILQVCIRSKQEIVSVFWKVWHNWL